MAGKFIVFEGIDSEVISHQASRMGEWLRSEGLPVVITREPTDGPIGALSRLVLDGRLAVDELTLAALFLADRMDHLYRKGGGVLYELEQGHHVVCVRYLLSAYAYQSEVAKLEWLKRINQPCSWPDLTIFIDTAVQQCLKRFVREEGYDDERLEAQRTQLAQKRRNYLQAIEQCWQDGNEVIVIDGEQRPDVIDRDCRHLVNQLGI